MLSSAYKTQIAESPDPKIESPEDVLVRVKAISICGTDSQIYSGNIGTKKLPIIMGHEAGGVVEEVGSNVRGLGVGAKVLIDPNILDGSCDLCARGLTNLCRNGGLMGRDSDGVFAEQVKLNAKSLYEIPATVDDLVIPLIQPLSTVVRGMAQLTIVPGDFVLIVGLGATGLLFAKLSKLRGAQVMGARRTWLGHMLPIAMEFGVDHHVDMSKEDLVREVERITEGRGADVIVLTANAPNLIQMCLDLVRPGGAVLQFFNYKATASYDAYQLYKKEIKLFATRSSVASDFLSAIKLVASREIRLDKMITGTFEFENAEKAFLANQDRKQNVKVLIKV